MRIWDVKLRTAVAPFWVSGRSIVDDDARDDPPAGVAVAGPPSPNG